MKITLDIDATDAKRGETLRNDSPLPPLPSWHSGGFRVNIANRDELYRFMEEEEEDEEG